MIEEEIEAAETELRDFKKSNDKDVSDYLKTGAILTVGAAAAVSLLPVTSVSLLMALGTSTMGIANTGFGIGSMLGGKIKEFRLRRKIKKLKRIQKEQNGNGQGLSRENSRTGKGRLYEEQKEKEAQLKEFKEKSDKSATNSMTNAYGMLLATCIVSPFFAPGVVLGGLGAATLFAGSAALKLFRAGRKERKMKKQIEYIKRRRSSEHDHDRSLLMRSRMNNLSNNGSRPVDRANLRGEMPKPAVVHPRTVDRATYQSKNSQNSI